MNEVNAMPHEELIAELMNPNNPKNEREHAAVREIKRLRERNETFARLVARHEREKVTKERDKACATLRKTRGQE